MTDFTTPGLYTPFVGKGHIGGRGWWGGGPVLTEENLFWAHGGGRQRVAVSQVLVVKHGLEFKPLLPIPCPGPGPRMLGSGKFGPRVWRWQFCHRVGDHCLLNRLSCSKKNHNNPCHWKFGLRVWRWQFVTGLVITVCWTGSLAVIKNPCH